MFSPVFGKRHPPFDGCSDCEYRYDVRTIVFCITWYRLIFTKTTQIINILIPNRIDFLLCYCIMVSEIKILLCFQDFVNLQNFMKPKPSCFVCAGRASQLCQHIRRMAESWQFSKVAWRKRKTALCQQAMWPKGRHCGRKSREKVGNRARTRPASIVQVRRIAFLCLHEMLPVLWSRYVQKLANKG